MKDKGVMTESMLLFLYRDPGKPGTVVLDRKILYLEYCLWTRKGELKLTLFVCLFACLFVNREMLDISDK